MTRWWPIVLRHPSLWAEAVRAAAAMAPRGWWRRPPFLPVPYRALVNWRVMTAYGTPDASIEPVDLVAYLRWRRGLRRG